MMRRSTRSFVFIIALIAGALVGSIAGSALSEVVPILGKGFAVGIAPPAVLDLKVITFTIGFTLDVNLAGALVVLILILLLGR